MSQRPGQRPARQWRPAPRRYHVRAFRPAVDASLNLWFTLDGLDRLIGAQRANPAASTLAFAYDLSGNRTGKTLNGATTTYTMATTSNRLTSLAGAETRSFAYDSAGNQTSGLRRR